jgi:hypothetical protein
VSDERLREALAVRDAEAPATKDCPEPGVLWDLASGNLGSARARAVGLHTVGCGACREALRLAREAGAVPKAAPRVSSRRWTVWAAAAAIVVVALVAFLRDPGVVPPVPSEFRDSVEASIRAIDGQATVDRGAPVVLRWSEIEGARYDLTVARENLEVLAVVRGLERGEYPLPADVLETVAPGEAVLWQVEAVGADGRRVRSATFSVRVR